jgi:flagellar protein FlbD
MVIVLQLTRLSGPVFALNPDLIERAEATPDTVVTLVNGSKYVIRESIDELVDLIQAYRANVVAAAQLVASAASVAPSGAPGNPGSSSTATMASASSRRNVSAMGTVYSLHPGNE